ncbi:MMPL family transporter [Hymenobacter sp. BT175]|uniref:efflux RND transporter permease subunit n=1 Tax=Hymenobacter translucens TaxID=2886507 RepID=UPI001D0E329C|nr:MMPL family transporter [Hymenobacter translucens]MCC2548861.1 MMPL family transporter [Hymenobacter translucens]
MIAILYKLRYGLLALTLVAVAMLGPGVKSALVVDNSLAVWFLPGDPALNAYQEFQRHFGNDEVVVVVVKGQPSVLSPADLRGFQALSRELEALPAVQSVFGPGNATVPRRGPTGTYAAPLLAPTTDAATVQGVLAPLPTLREELFTPDYTAARFVIVLRQAGNFDEQRGAILDGIRNTVYRHFPASRASLGGIGVIYAGLNALSQQDFGFFLGVGYLLMIVAFVLIYRNFVLLAYALGIVGLSTYLTLGVYGALGYRINIMTVLLPVVIILLGLMDALHVVNERNQLEAAGRGDRRDSALKALRDTLYPCAYTSFTTAAGFLSLLTSPMAILKNFGLFAALGIGLCLVYTYVLGVLLLPLAQPNARSTRQASTGVVRFYTWVLRHKGVLSVASLLLMLGLAAGVPRLRSDTYTLGYFPPDHPVVRDHAAMQAAWGPYLPLELLVRPRPGQSLHSASVVQAATAFSDSVRQVPGVGKVFGFHSLYQAGLEAELGAKGRKALGSQSALNRADKTLRTEYPALAGQFMADSGRLGRITVSGAMLSASQLTAKTDSLLGIARATLGAVATVTPAGYQPMYAGIVSYVTSSQTNSLLLSFILVFALVWLFIRDFRLALLTVIPNLFPVLVVLGVMGWLGITLDTASASIAAIVLSISVDDTMHFVYQYRQNRRAGQSPEQARLHTIAHVGPAIVLTSAILFLGYAFMMLGSLKTVQLFGSLTAVAIAGALLGELIIFPIVLERFDRRK